MKNALILFLSVLVIGCAAGYQTGEITDKFSDPTQPAIFSMRGNAIDYSDPLGSLRTSEMNGFVARDRATGKVKYTGFFLSRVTNNTKVGFSGAAKWLTIRAGDEAVFLADN